LQVVYLLLQVEELVVARLAIIAAGTKNAAIKQRAIKVFVRVKKLQHVTNHLRLSNTNLPASNILK
jgi:hypothetical protein